VKPDSPRLDGKRIVITGATSGIGRATAEILAKSGANLVLIGRNAKEGSSLASRFSNSAPNAQFEFIAADLSSLEQVRSAAERISAKCQRIDMLINNAGVRCDRYERTVDGYERTFATNHLGHFLLTGLLLGRLAEASSARIINVTSSAAAQAEITGPWQFEAAGYDRRQAYAKSKLANLLFTGEFVRRNGSRINCVAADPGVVATRFARNNGVIAWLKHIISHGRKLELKSARAGADSLVYLATSPHLPAEANGKCYRDRKPIVICPAANDAEAASALWALSVSLTGIEPCLVSGQIH